MRPHEPRSVDPAPKPQQHKVLREGSALSPEETVVLLTQDMKA